MFVCVYKAFVASFQHFLVAWLGAKTVVYYGMMMQVAGHAVLVGNQPLGCPGTLRFFSWPG